MKNGLAVFSIVVLACFLATEAQNAPQVQQPNDAGETRSAAYAAVDSEHQDFRKLAQELLPNVRRHLDMAKQIQKDLQGGSRKSD